MQPQDTSCKGHYDPSLDMCANKCTSIDECKRITAAAKVPVEGKKDLKIEINELIWRYAPSDTTIGDAEEIAIKILHMISEGRTDPLST